MYAPIPSERVIVLLRRLRKTVGRCWSGGRHVIEDALAAVALNNLIVAEDRVEHLRPQPDVAHGTNSVAGLGDRHAAAAAQDELEDREHLRIESAHDLPP